jgi:hypothetical protein
MRTKVLLVAFGLIPSFAGPLYGAVNTVIDFESLRVVDNATHDHGFVYAEDGFTLNNLANDHGLATFGVLEPRFPGSTALFNNTVDGVTELIKTGGGAFHLTSIDLAELNGADHSIVAFTGELLGGGSVNQTFTLDGIGPANGLQTFVFNGFNDVVRVRWTQAAPYHQFDNITLGAVPEPGTMALLLTIVTWLVGIVWRSRRSFG